MSDKIRIAQPRRAHAPDAGYGHAVEVLPGAAVENVASVTVEVQRIMRTGTIWTAAGVLAPVIGLGPLLAGGWRPMDLPGGVEAMFWIASLIATAGLGLLMWAGCPVMAYTVERAYWQKKHSIRIGICMNLIGMALAGLAVIATPVA